MTTSIHVCLVSDDFLPAVSGVGVHLGLVVPALVAGGHKVSVLTTRQKGQLPRESALGADVHRVRALKVFDFYQGLPTRAEIRRVLDEVRPDLVHHHYASLMMRQVVDVAAAVRIPQLSTYHFGPEVLTQPWPLRPLRGWIGNEMVRVNNRCAAVICPSANLVTALKAQGIGVPIHHLSNPVAFADAALATPADRPAAPVVMYAGRLGVEKNVGLLIKAFGHVLQRWPDALLWIAGRGPEEAALRAEAARLPRPGQAVFLGFLDHAALAKYYTACDVFVLPSVQEVQPMVAIEAMRFGKPVLLTSALASATELVKPGINGHIVSPDDPTDLAQRLCELLAAPSLMVQMGHASQRLSAAFEPQAMVAGLERIYGQVLRR
jgi:glycosyltransferase involved in cell wall biosynthesis